MTLEQQLFIRAELARRMGYTNFREVTLYSLAGPVNELICDPPLGVDPNTRFLECSVTGRAAFSASVPPDPFTSAEDKDALVAWICANDYKSAFGDELLKALGIRDKFLGDRFPAEFHIADILNAPLETITLAAARALGISIDDPPDQA